MSVALEQAIITACHAHYGQKDRAGQPYILHALRVMAAMKDETSRIAAILHDVVEDCEDVTIERNWIEFGQDVGLAVDALTKRDGEDYDAYLARIEANPTAVKVKLADLRDNSDMTRLERATDKDWERYEKYQMALSRLMEAEVSGPRPPSPTDQPCS